MIWTTTYLTSVGWFVMKFAFTSIHGPQRMKPTGTCSVFFCKATVTLTLNEILKNLIQTVYSWCPEDEPYCLWQFSSRAKFALIQWTGKSPNFSWIMAFWIDIHDPLRMNFHTFVDCEGIRVLGVQSQWFRLKYHNYWNLVQTVIVTRGWIELWIIPIIVPSHHHIVGIFSEPSQQLMNRFNDNVVHAIMLPSGWIHPFEIMPIFALWFNKSHHVSSENKTWRTGVAGLETT